MLLSREIRIHIQNWFTFRFNCNPSIYNQTTTSSSLYLPTLISVSSIIMNCDILVLFFYHIFVGRFIIMLYPIPVLLIHDFFWQMAIINASLMFFSKLKTRKVQVSVGRSKYTLKEFCFFWIWPFKEVGRLKL
jgi:hypothetical protein